MLQTPEIEDQILREREGEEKDDEETEEEVDEEAGADAEKEAEEEAEEVEGSRGGRRRRGGDRRNPTSTNPTSPSRHQRDTGSTHHPRTPSPTRRERRP